MLRGGMPAPRSQPVLARRRGRSTRSSHLVRWRLPRQIKKMEPAASTHTKMAGASWGIASRIRLNPASLACNSAIISIHGSGPPSGVATPCPMSTAFRHRPDSPGEPGRQSGKCGTLKGASGARQGCVAAADRRLEDGRSRAARRQPARAGYSLRGGKLAVRNHQGAHPCADHRLCRERRQRFRAHPRRRRGPPIQTAVAVDGSGEQRCGAGGSGIEFVAVGVQGVHRVPDGSRRRGDHLEAGCTRRRRVPERPSRAGERHGNQCAPV